MSEETAHASHSQGREQDRPGGVTGWYTGHPKSTGEKLPFCEQCPLENVNSTSAVTLRAVTLKAWWTQVQSESSEEFWSDKDGSRV